jgi:2'-5' RNA ligase
VSSLAETISAVAYAARNIKSFKVVSDGYGFQDTWSRILYIKIKPNPILSTIRKNIGKELGDTENREFSPHISLMYKDKLSLAERDKIISTLNIPNNFAIKGIQIVSPGTSNDDWRDYTKWKVLHTITFLDN